MSPAVECPLVSVVMANYNGAPYLAAAIRSALTQSLAGIEILLADDGSTDESLAIARAIAAEDPRLIVLPPAPNGGPGAARNRGLAAARGEWVAVMDSDDLMHPERLERLLAAATRDGVDIIADDMLAFFEDGSPPQPMLHGRLALPATVDLALYIRANVLFGRLPALGYLKPLFRAEMLRRTGLRYDPSLRIAEDYDLVARLLAQGAQFRILPDLTYFYRRHGTSTSHRLRRSDLEAMLASDNAFRAAVGPQPRSTEAAFRARRASIERALAYDGIIAALKARDPVAALREAIRSPSGAALLRLPVRDRLSRVFARPKKPAQEGPQPQRRPRGLRVYVVSRNRVVGSTSGSAAYLLALCRAMAEAGHELHLVWPSPAMFGRTPVLRLRPEMTMFRSIAMHEAWRIGSWLVAKNPRVALAACLGIADKLLRKVGLGLGGLVRKAPYAVAVPWREEDLLYVANRIRGDADVVLADYAFLTPAYPYALSPGAARIVVMHDLFSSRAAIFARAGSQDSVARIDQASELRLLGAADAVVAIQAEEGAFIRDALPGRRVIVAPIAIEPVAAPQPGRDAILLFVGSDTSPNVDGLRWFLREVLPLIRQAVPQVVLRVVGRVGHAIGPVPETLTGAVEVLGLVPDLAPYYRDAAVVVSPLLAGSGLKIKLVEALGHGKAVVATSVTLQGVQAECAPALRPIDEAGEFAAEVTALLTDSALRAERAAASLLVARNCFSATACYAGLLDYLRTVRPDTEGTPAPRPRMTALAE
ncbi:glycosyltransferase [Roseicella aerolata]|uniref:Glycosyltransferase n=1 Tax=Roseicella aerolata TaxID=2883479 RepID=A0A9X1IJZ2_9PROT|nr:glycosyltransferase [Roseicella aerolata]MCB4825554.1 glycosyltransferase [Roseicella aerolata]